ncbi:RES domain-containing protein [Hymenobacter monticola]|uniref:RES domain-containing protein n=1 Tax=Hymenobacter monticola TaxID=1705399 RepID=A0ABY4B372_9BACT|nr:RES domain-containing protein [Hymenobacter monticola]UOE33604.1 RES domain-containing protein [Hymenobacter monticola]
MKPDAPVSAADSIKRRLASLRHLDLRRHSIDDLVQRVRELLEGQPLRCLTLAPGRLLYRGILCEELPAGLADVSYPPAERVHHDQRANRAGAPMFYCSATWHPPFFEAHVQPGDGIVISRWQTQQPLCILSFGYADNCADDPHSDRERALRYALAQLPDETRELAAFLTRTFTRTVADDNRHHYRLSIAVAEACQLGQAFDGLLYPSAAMASPAHNLALHPSCLDAGMLTLDYVEHLRVHHVSPDTEVLDVRSLDIARTAGPDGRLEWQGRPGNWVLREGSAATDCWLQNGEWRCG